jgi:Bacterial PH domain
VWLLFAVANWIDLAVQGRDHTSAVAAAILLLATGAAYVTAQRPRIIADKAGLTVRNPLRDHRIGWTGVARVDLAGLLRVHCEWGQHRKVISAWAVPYSKRRQFAAEASARRQAKYLSGRRSPLGFPSGGGRGLGYGTPGAGPAASAAEAEAEKVARLLREHAAAAQAAARTEAASSEPLASTWSARAIAALVIPALILLVVWLL